MGPGPRQSLARAGWALAAALGCAGAWGLVALDDAAPLAHADDSTSKKIWMLELEHAKPKRIRIGIEPNVQSYLYLPFTLTNPDDKDHSFFLEVWAESDKGKTYRPVASQVVLAKVRHRLGVKPFERLWSQEDFTTAHDDQPLPPDPPLQIKLPTIPGGEAVQCVVVFTGPDPEMDKMTIRFRGLTNDVHVVKTDDPHERILKERVLALEYRRQGDEFFWHEDPIDFVERRWETQETLIKTDLD